MIRTKHVLIFFGVLICILLITFVYVLVEHALAPAEEDMVTEEVPLIESTAEYRVTSQEETLDRDRVREDLIAKLEAEGPLEEVVLETSDMSSESPEDEEGTNLAAGPLPVTSLYVNGAVHIGTLGSYCWGTVCQDALISDLPYEPYRLASTSPVRFAIDATASPERVIFFLRNIADGTVAFQKELTPHEVESGTLSLGASPGTYILFITGVWTGGGDVVNAFKVTIF